jgi:hypothetical protein
MAGIFEGVDALIDRALRVTDIGRNADRRYATKTCALRLTSKPYGFDAAELCKSILQQIEHNWRNGDTSVRMPSRENWRLEKQTYISDGSPSLEKILEKEIVSKLGADWVNQVPTASGLINSTANKHCNLDLVHILSPSEYELIEVKIGSDTPLFAAFELLKYAMVCIFSREHADTLNYIAEEKPLLFAAKVHLVVLAPHQFYSGYQVIWLETELNRSLAAISRCHSPAMDFHFEYFRVVDGENDPADIVASRRRLFPA